VCGDELLDETGFYVLRSDLLGTPCAAAGATAALEAYSPFVHAPDVYGLVCVDISYLTVNGGAAKCVATANALNAVIEAHANGNLKDCDKVSKYYRTSSCFMYTVVCSGSFLRAL